MDGQEQKQEQRKKQDQRQNQEKEKQLLLAQKVCGDIINLSDYEVVIKPKDNKIIVYCHNKLNNKKAIVCYSHNKGGILHDILHGKCCVLVDYYNYYDICYDNTIVTWIDNPDIKLTCCYKNGKLHGGCEFIDIVHSVSTITHYMDGVLHGKYAIVDGGYHFDTNFINGQLHGKTRSSYYGKGIDFDTNISVEIAGYYNNGLNHGIWTVVQSDKPKTTVTFPDSYDEQTIVTVTEDKQVAYLSIAELLSQMSPRSRWISTHPYDHLFIQ